VFAHSAGHVVASLVLLDTGVACGTLARVREDPVGGLGLVLALLHPVCELRAAARIVCVVATLKAIRCATGATDGCHSVAHGHFVAARSWTVTHELRSSYIHAQV
jgi:hypothetical protein